MRAIRSGLFAPRYPRESKDLSLVMMLVYPVFLSASLGDRVPLTLELWSYFFWAKEGVYTVERYRSES